MPRLPGVVVKQVISQPSHTEPGKLRHTKPNQARPDQTLRPNTHEY